MSKVTSKRYKTVYNPSKPFTDIRLSKSLCLKIRMLGISGQSGENVLRNMYEIISSDPELVKQMKEISKRKIKHDE